MQGKERGVRGVRGTDVARWSYGPRSRHKQAILSPGERGWKHGDKGKHVYFPTMYYSTYMHPDTTTIDTYTTNHT